MNKETTRKTCLNCGHEFTYREKFQSMYRFWWRMNCGACGIRYNVLMRYRLLFGLLLVLPYIALNGYILSHSGMLESLLLTFGISLVWIAALFFFMPLITSLKLDPKEEVIQPDKTKPM